MYGYVIACINNVVISARMCKIMQMLCRLGNQVFEKRLHESPVIDVSDSFPDVDKWFYFRPRLLVRRNNSFTASLIRRDRVLYHTSTRLRPLRERFRDLISQQIIALKWVSASLSVEHKYILNYVKPHGNLVLQKKRIIRNMENVNQRKKSFFFF